MIKSVDHTNDYTNWVMYDNKRNGYNRDNEYVFASTTEAEMSNILFIFILTGFKYMIIITLQIIQELICTLHLQKHLLNTQTLDN